MMTTNPSSFIHRSFKPADARRPVTFAGRPFDGQRNQPLQFGFWGRTQPALIQPSIWDVYPLKGGEPYIGGGDGITDPYALQFGKKLDFMA